MTPIYDPLAGRLGGLLPSVVTRGGLGPTVLRRPQALMIVALVMNQ